MPTVLRGSDNFDSGLGLGVGQTWQNVTGSRALGTTYTNSTGRPIMIMVFVTSAASYGFIQCSFNGAATTTVGGTGWIGSASNFQGGVTLIIPAGQTYNVTVTSGSLSNWMELR